MLVEWESRLRTLLLWGCTWRCRGRRGDCCVRINVRGRLSARVSVLRDLCAELGSVRSFARETTNHTHEIKLHCAPLQYPRTKTFRCRVQQSQRPAFATRGLRCKSKVHAVFTRYVPLRCIGHGEITPSVKGMCTSRRSCRSGRGCALEFGDRMLHDCAREDEWKSHGGWDRDRGWYLKRMQVR